MTVMFCAALLLLNLDFKSDPSYMDTQLLERKKKSKGSITDPNFPGLLHNSVWSEYIFSCLSRQTPLICHRITLGANEKWKTETPSESSPHNIKESFRRLFLHANVPLNVWCTQTKKKSNLDDNFQKTWSLNEVVLKCFMNALWANMPCRG